MVKVLFSRSVIGKVNQCRVLQYLKRLDYILYSFIIFDQFRSQMSVFQTETSWFLVTPLCVGTIFIILSQFFPLSELEYRFLQMPECAVHLINKRLTKYLSIQSIQRPWNIWMKSKESWLLKNPLQHQVIEFYAC